MNKKKKTNISLQYFGHVVQICKILQSYRITSDGKGTKDINRIYMYRRQSYMNLTSFLDMIDDLGK